MTASAAPVRIAANTCRRVRRSRGGRPPGWSMAAGRNSRRCCAPRPGRRIGCSCRCAGAARYAWPELPGGESRATLVALARARALRRLPAVGGALPRAMLGFDRRLAEAYASRLSYRHTHLVVGQGLLPHLWRLGCLQGRSFDVLMERWPLAALQARLDRAAGPLSGEPDAGRFPGAGRDRRGGDRGAGRGVPPLHPAWRHRRALRGPGGASGLGAAGCRRGAAARDRRPHHPVPGFGPGPQGRLRPARRGRGAGHRPRRDRPGARAGRPVLAQCRGAAPARRRLARPGRRSGAAGDRRAPAAGAAARHGDGHPGDRHRRLRHRRRTGRHPGAGGRCRGPARSPVAGARRRVTAAIRSRPETPHRCRRSPPPPHRRTARRVPASPGRGWSRCGRPGSGGGSRRHRRTGPRARSAGPARPI